MHCALTHWCPARAHTRCASIRHYMFVCLCARSCARRYASGHHAGRAASVAMGWREHSGIRVARLDAVVPYFLRENGQLWVKVVLCTASLLNGPIQRVQRALSPY